MLQKMVQMRLWIAAIGAVIVTPALQAQETADYPDEEITLAQALQRAGARSPAVEAAQADVDAARGNELQASYGPNPEISVDVENIAGNGAFTGFRSTETTAVVGQRLELGGKRGARTRAARELTTVARIEAAATDADIAASVRSHYSDALAARKRLDIARTIVERNRELARIASELVNAGREPPLRSLRAQAALGEAEATLESAVTDDYSARLSLATLWGAKQPPQSVSEIWLGSQSVPDEIDPAKVYSVQLAVAQARAGQAVVDRERAYAVPDLTLSGGVRRFEASNDTAFVVGASIAIPIGNRNQGGIAAAEANARGYAARRSLALLVANRDISSARASLESACKRVVTLQSMTLPQAEEALKLANIGYRYGRFSLVEVLDAAGARDSAETNLIDARRAAAEAAIVLLRLAGE